MRSLPSSKRTQALTSSGPAGVRVTFSVAECDGTPVPDVTADDFTVINDETGQPFQSEGGSAAFVEALKKRAEAKGETFDPKSVTGPLVTWQLRGLGARFKS